jgi:hypothetical protein
MPSPLLTTAHPSVDQCLTNRHQFQMLLQPPLEAQVVPALPCPATPCSCTSPTEHALHLSWQPLAPPNTPFLVCMIDVGQHEPQHAVCFAAWLPVRLSTCNCQTGKTCLQNRSAVSSADLTDLHWQPDQPPPEVRAQQQQRRSQ